MDGRGFDWRLWAGAPLAAGVVVAAALAMPVRLPETGAEAGPVERLPEVAARVAPEELSAFLDLRRWGAPPEESDKAEPAPEEAGPVLNPILAEMGFVGLIAVQDERAVLLALPEGEIVRMLPGDILPDGRILVSVADNSLTLAAEGGPEEVLTLFPRLPADPPASPAAAPDAGGEEGAPAAALVSSQ